MTTLDLITTFVAEECCNCHMQFAMTKDFQQQRRNDHQSFYCPQGHGMHYSGKSEKEKLEEEKAFFQRRLASEESCHANTKRWLESSKRRLAATRGAMTKVRNRVGNGVCPCCNRHFRQLAAHMKTKHPDYSGHDAAGKGDRA